MAAAVEIDTLFSVLVFVCVCVSTVAVAIAVECRHNYFTK